MSDTPNDVQLIHAGLCTVVDEWGPLPIFGHTVSGNDNGHTAVAEQLALLQKHLRPTELTMISDRGTFSVGHLLRLEDAGYHAIVAAPWDEFRPLFDQQRAALEMEKSQLLVDRATAAPPPGQFAAGTLRIGRRAARVDRGQFGPNASLPRDLRVQHGRPEGRPQEPREVRGQTPRRIGADCAECGGGTSLHRSDRDRTPRGQVVRPAAGGRILPLRDAALEQEGTRATSAPRNAVAAAPSTASSSPLTRRPLTVTPPTTAIRPW